jgi:hypothetical protein
MGTDIYFFVERREADGWKQVTKPHEPCEYCEGKGTKEFKHGGEGECFMCDGTGKHSAPFYNSRNYCLFGILADVRNGVGFAGIPYGEPLTVMAPPRGLPEDVSATVRAEEDSIGHSASWFTVAELEAYDWTQTSKQTGWVDLKTYAKWKAAGSKGYPEEYCGDVSGSTVRHVSNRQADRLIEGSEGPLHPDTYTRIYWQVPYSEAAGDFYSETLPALRALGKPEDVRIVFWFDC